MVTAPCRSLKSNSACEVHANAHTVPAPGAARIFVERSGVLAKMSATAAPMKPKKGALAGQSSFDMSSAEEFRYAAWIDPSFTTHQHAPSHHAKTFEDKGEEESV